MKVIIDTNLLFSAIIKPDGIVAEIILNPTSNLKIIGCYFSYIELFKHKEKLLKTSKLKESDLLEVMYNVLKRIDFLNESIIPTHIFEEAYLLTKDVDEKDTVFVAMGNYLNCKIWTGDMELKSGLEKKGYFNFVITDELK